MERLTEVTIEDGVKLYDISSELCLSKTTHGEKIAAILKKLAEYEGLEEQGRLLKLPCKVGDTVYYINPDKNTINELVVYGFDIRPLQRFVYDYMGARLNFNQFGKTVFLIESEAEAKLKELRGGENGK